MGAPDEPNGQLMADAAGIALFVASGAALYLGLMPWYATALGAAVGLGLFLPRRLREAFDIVMDNVERFAARFTSSKVRSKEPDTGPDTE